MSVLIYFIFLIYCTPFLSTNIYLKNKEDKKKCSILDRTFSMRHTSCLATRLQLMIHSVPKMLTKYTFFSKTRPQRRILYMCGGGMGEMIWVSLPLRILNINANQGKIILSTDKSHNLHASSVFSYNIKFVVVYIITIRYYCV